MKFEVKSSDLVRVLRKTIKGYDPREEGSYIALELTEDGELTITSRSRVAFFKGSVPASNVEIADGDSTRYYVDGLTLRQLSSIFPNAPIDIKFEINEKTQLFNIVYPGNRFKLGVSSNYTAPQEYETKDIATVTANDLMPVWRDLLKITSTAAEVQEHQASCISMHFEDDVLTLMATDTYAFGEIKIEYTDGDLSDENQFLIRHSEINLLMDTFGPGETITLTTSKGMFGYYDEDGTLALVGQTNLPPLDYKQILSLIGTENYVLVEQDDLKSAIDTIQKLTEDNLITLNITEDSDTMKITNSLGNAIEVPLNEKVINEDFSKQIAINIILETLAPANTDTIKIQWGDNLDAASLIGIAPILDDGTEEEDITLCAALYTQAA